MQNSPYTQKPGRYLYKRLFQIAVKALKDDGWHVERIDGCGKASIRRISKDGDSKVVSIRTTESNRIVFSRAGGNNRWLTLDEVDAVVAVSVDSKDNPKFVKIHMLDGQDVRLRFDRAYEARMNAGQKIGIGSCVYILLYVPEADKPVSLVGAGAGLETQAIIVPYTPELMPLTYPSDTNINGITGSSPHPSEKIMLTIAAAKHGLAVRFGVDPNNIKITIEA